MNSIIKSLIYYDQVLQCMLINNSGLPDDLLSVVMSYTFADAAPILEFDVNGSVIEYKSINQLLTITKQDIIEYKNHKFVDIEKYSKGWLATLFDARSSFEMISPIISEMIHEKRNEYITTCEKFIKQMVKNGQEKLFPNVDIC